MFKHIHPVTLAIFFEIRKLLRSYLFISRSFKITKFKSEALLHLGLVGPTKRASKTNGPFRSLWYDRIVLLIERLA